MSVSKQTHPPYAPMESPMDIVTPTALQAATAALFATRGLPTATRNAVLEDIEKGLG